MRGKLYDAALHAKLYDAALHALLDEISVGFVDPRNDSISLTTLDELTTRSAGPVDAAAQVRKMHALVRYLVILHGNVFSVEAGELVLRATVSSDRTAVKLVVQSFEIQAHRQVARINGRGEDNNGDCPYKPPSGSMKNEPLKTFMDDFYEEIARMRRGISEDYQ